MPKGWGQVIVGTRLEKQVDSRFFCVWQEIITRGLAPGDGCLSVRGKVAHKAANELVRDFLATEADSLLFLDSDADAPWNIIDLFRQYEAGQQYDVLQAFTTRRGWPPRALWMKRNALGDMTEYFVTPDMDGIVEDVDVVPLHCTMVRREVFERILGDADPDEFEWFYYPRHKPDSEDAPFTQEAIEHGFRVGATTAIKVGHISTITTSWETHQDWLRFTGRLDLIKRYRRLAELVGQYLDEDAETVVAKSLQGRERVADAWRRTNAQTPEEVRAFYGAPDNGYLYDLVGWNCQPLYQRIISPLLDMRGVSALVVGAGIGTEVEALDHSGNVVDIVELPGVLSDFLKWRFDGEYRFRTEIPSAGQYDVLVLVDVLEHVHPDELGETLSRLERLTHPGTQIIAHMGGTGELQPQHYDNGPAVSAMFQQYEHTGEFVWTVPGGRKTE